MRLIGITCTTHDSQACVADPALGTRPLATSYDTPTEHKLIDYTCSQVCGPDQKRNPTKTYTPRKQHPDSKTQAPTFTTSFYHKEPNVSANTLSTPMPTSLCQRKASKHLRLPSGMLQIQDRSLPNSLDPTNPTQHPNTKYIIHQLKYVEWLLDSDPNILLGQRARPVTVIKI